MNAFHVLGSLAAIWALLVSFTGIARENFPATRRTEIAVSLISVLMFVLAVGSGIWTATEEEAEGEDPAGEHALVIPR